MPTDPNRVKVIFLEAVEQPGEAARVAYLDRACGGDAGLRERVEAILRSHDPAGSFLGTPAATVPDPGHAGTKAFGSSYPADELGLDHDDGSDGLHFLTPSARPDSLGRIGHYEVLQVLGRGGFGIVLRAFDDVLQRVVAVKVMAPQLAATSPARKRFLREARTSAQVRHENVVQVYEVAEQPLPYLAMEFIPGETLQQRLNRTGPLDVPEVLRIGRQIAEGLAAAHATDLIHRDIKPANVLIEGGQQQRVKITDFGLARAADDASISQSSIIAGTPMYMAPEQALGQKLDQRADLFSLGSVLYQMASGRAPFRANSTVAVLKRVAEDTPRAIREIIPETPQWLCDIIAKLHAKNRDDRYQSARDVADVFADCEAQLKANARLKDFSRIPRGKPASSGKRKWAAAAVVLLPVIALAGTEVAGVTHLFRGQQAAHDPIKPGGDPTPVVVPFGAPSPEAKTPAPAAAAWESSVAAMTATEQVKAVSARLKERNPGFDGTLTPTIENEVVTGLTFTSDRVTDISPVRALVRLRTFEVRGSGWDKGSLADLTPLTGMPLSVLLVDANKVSDLTPLKGMPLEHLSLWQWHGSDLTPLKGMPLKRLNCGGRGQKIDLTPLAGLPLDFLCINFLQVSDLSPLKGVPLTTLMCSNTQVSDLTSLRGMRLQRLHIDNCKVSDLTPIRGMPLHDMEIEGASVTDLSPLKDLPLKRFKCDFQAARDAKVLRAIKTLETINGKRAAVFWKEVDAQTKD